jgi:CubicO group peptidase (beta-lactamase class C family)
MKRESKSKPIDGVVEPGFEAVATVLEQQLARYSGGAAVCVYHRGQCVVDIWGGHRDDGETPWQRDTLAPSFSTTKGVTSTLIHIMADRGLIDYDALVSKYWPEFAQAGKEEITVRQVLAHQAGLYHIRQMIDDASQMRDWDYMISAIEKTEPIHIPGERTGYHGLTYGFLAGEILQRVTGEKFSDLVRTEIAEPLALDGLFVGAPDSELHRSAELLWPSSTRYMREMPAHLIPNWVTNAADTASSLLSHGLGMMGVDLDLASILDALGPKGIAKFDFGSHETLKATIPAGNGLFTARSLARMYAALAGGGELDGVRLLSETQLVKATEMQSEGEGRSVLPIDMKWRLGYHGVPTTRGMVRRAFGHFGFGGSGAWADPERQLALAMTVNSGMGTPLGDLRIMRVGGAALGAARQRDGVLVSPIARSLDSSITAARSWVGRRRATKAKHSYT